MSRINYHLSNISIMSSRDQYKHYSWFIEKDHHNDYNQDHNHDHDQNSHSLSLTMGILEPKAATNYRHKSSSNNTTKSINKTILLPPSEILPRNEALGGYIFVCNNETMKDDLRRQLFGLPPKYKDSVRAIVPGLPLFLYNYTTHQLHGLYQAESFGGSNIDPMAWLDNKCRLGGSRFPAQVRIRIKKKCKPLEEDAFRPILYHYDGPKFRLQLSVPEALALLDLFNEVGDY